MYKKLVLASITILMSFSVYIDLAATEAIVVLETAPPTPGPGTTNGGASLAQTQWLGARFAVDEPVRITQIGGHVKSSSSYLDRSLFAVLVPVLESTGLPSDPLLNEAIFVTVFDAPYNDVGPYPYQVPDTIFEVDFILYPGNYALIFGSGLFGATGAGWMPERGTLIPLSWFFLRNPPDDFRNIPRGQLIRFFVYGSSAVIEVDIDIKPGGDPNCFNIDGNGVIPVAVLGSVDFDVNDIDIDTLSFAGLAVRIKGNDARQCSVEDVSGDFTSPEGVPDGYPDLVCQFIDDPNRWSPDDGTAKLTGGTAGWHAY